MIRSIKNTAYPIQILAILSFLSIILISFFKSALELEDAEQAYYSQWWRWGYDDQPPLYTWLQIGVNSIFGVTKFSFSFLRATIFAGTLLAMFTLAIRIGENKQKAAIAVLSLSLIPVFIDFTFRRLSHTSLLCLLILLTFIIIEGLLRHRSFKNYILLGLVTGLGILVKYNFALLLVALLLLLFVNKKYRKVLLDLRIIVSIGIAVLLIAPHFWWLLENKQYLYELNESINAKISVDKDASIPFITPVYSYLLTLIKLIWPLALVVGVLLVSKQIFWKKHTVTPWLTQLFYLQLVVLGVVFAVFDISKVETRWLLPLLLPYIPILIFSIDFPNQKKYVRFSFMVFIIVILFQTVRTPIEKLANIPSSVHFGFQPISKILNERWEKKQWMLPDVTYGGNIHLLNPRKVVFSSDDFSLPIKKLDTTNTVFVQFEKPEKMHGFIVKDSLIDFGKEKQKLYFITYIR